MNLQNYVDLAVILSVIIILMSTYQIWKQYKKREELVSKKDEEKAMKEALEMFEKELSAELDKIAMSDNPLEALMKMGQEPELDPIKDFNKILKKPEGEPWQ